MAAVIEPSAALTGQSGFPVEEYQEDRATGEHGKPQDRVRPQLPPRRLRSSGGCPLVNKEGMRSRPEAVPRLKEEFQPSSRRRWRSWQTLPCQDEAGRHPSASTNQKAPERLQDQTVRSASASIAKDD